MQFTHKISKRTKNLTIRVEPSGEIIVTTPKFIPKFIINNFVNSRKTWINTALAKIKFQKSQIADDEIMLFGKPAKKLDFKYANLDRFLKNTAEKYIIPRTHQLAGFMGLNFKKITLRQQKTRWGSCSSDKNLNFNWRLVHHPIEVIDYVIIHELAHLKHLDHSKNFWQFVNEFDPSFKRHRNYLKRRGMSY
jgi:predicted metal-dependent hydrolase